MDAISAEKQDSEAMRETLAELIADQATRHVDEVGFKFLLEPYTVSNILDIDMGRYGQELTTGRPGLLRPWLLVYSAQPSDSLHPRPC